MTAPHDDTHPVQQAAAELYDVLGAVAREAELAARTLRAIDQGLSPPDLAGALVGLTANVERIYGWAADARIRWAP